MPATPHVALPHHERARGTSPRQHHGGMTTPSMGNSVCLFVQRVHPVSSPTQEEHSLQLDMQGKVYLAGMTSHLVSSPSQCAAASSLV